MDPAKFGILLGELAFNLFNHSKAASQASTPLKQPGSRRLVALRFELFVNGLTTRGHGLEPEHLKSAGFRVHGHRGSTRSRATAIGAELAQQNKLVQAVRVLPIEARLKYYVYDVFTRKTAEARRHYHSM